MEGLKEVTGSVSVRVAGVGFSEESWDGPSVEPHYRRSAGAKNLRSRTGLSSCPESRWQRWDSVPGRCLELFIDGREAAAESHPGYCLL